MNTKTKRSPYDAQITVRIPGELKATLQKIARRRNELPAQVIVKALRRLALSFRRMQRMRRDGE